MYIDHELTHNMIAGLSFTKEGREIVSIDRPWSCSLRSAHTNSSGNKKSRNSLF